MNNYNFTNSTVIITGASSGIGWSLAHILIEQYDATVIAIAKNSEKLDNVKTAFGDKSNRYEVFPFDVSDYSKWQEFASALEQKGYYPDVLINCAGVLPEFKSVEKTDAEIFESVIKINYLSMVYSAKTILPLIRKKGNNGIVINVTSSSALCPFAGISAYSSSKAAAERFSECLAVEEKTVSVTTVMPGFTKTNVMRNQTLTKREQKLINKFSKNPYDVAKKILKKASHRKKRVITGIDAYFMNFMFKHFPNFTPKFITKFLIKHKLSAYVNMFDN